jgi:hypothetical protein
MSQGGFYSDSRDFPDGTHPNDQGYAKMATIWKPFLTAILDSGVVSPTPPPPPADPGASTLTATVDEKTASGTNFFTYTGASWTDCGGCNGGTAYMNSFKYGYTTGNKFVFTFTGTQAKLYGFKEPVGGIATISIDNGAAKDVDYYAAQRAADVIYTTPTLTNAKHTITVTVLGRKAAGTSPTINIDKAEVYK